MPTTHSVKLTDSMLQRLATIDDKYRQDGDPNDNTRLCNSWRGAIDSDKVELKKIATDVDLAGRLTVSKIRKENPKFSIYTTACMQNAVSNYRRQAKQAIEKREDSKFAIVPCFVFFLFSTATNYACLLLYKVEISGGNKQGLIAMASSPRGGNCGGQISVCGTKKSRRMQSPSGLKPPPAASRSPAARFKTTGTMYKCDGTVRSNRSVNTTGGMSMAGKTLGANGKVSNQPLPGVARAVMNHTVDEPIGGALAFSQVDPWTDKSLNARASCDLWVSNGVALNNGTLQCRPSSRENDVLVITFALSDTFTNPDIKLGYLLSRIMETYELANDKNQAMKILQNHPRYIAAKGNLQSLLGSHGDKGYLVEYRIRAPFPISEDLVTCDEDKVFFGHHMETNEETGETHIHFELKHSKKPFKPVVVDGVVHSSFSLSQTPGRKSMFATKCDLKMEPAGIPGAISFKSPNPRLKKSDDSSTIATNDRHARKGMMVAIPEEKKKSSDKEDADWDPDLMDFEEYTVANQEEVNDLKQEIKEMKAIMTGMYQMQANGGNTTTLAVSSPKKKKAEDGTADSVAGSRRSTNTRGSLARDAKRKGNKKDDNDKKEPPCADGNGDDTTL